MMPTRLFRHAIGIAVALLILSAAAHAQVVRPAPPKEYDATIRFQIRAPLPGWYDRFDEMIADLKRYGFVREPLPAGEPEDPSNDRIRGVVGPDNARSLLLVPAVRTVLLRPHGVAFKPDEQVKVQIELASGLPPEAQLRLTRQSLEKLALLGFREAIGYDHRGFTRVVGTVPTARLDDLLRDLRALPGGWLVPQDPISTLELPIRNVVPVKVIEVLPEPNDVPPAQEPPTPPAFPEERAHLAKVAPDLQALVSKEGDDTKFLRVELVLAYAPDEDDVAWERLLRGTASSVMIEGRLGNVVTVRVRATQATELARPASVLWARLPRSGEAQRRPPAGPTVDALGETRLGRLHAMGYRGKGIRIAVVGGDFGGYDKLLGNRLPRSTQIIDFTATRNPSLEPDPMPSSDGATGSGTLAALAVHLAAPDADLVLVRVDPTAPYQMLLLARLLNEPNVSPRVLEDRYTELTRDRAAIDEGRARAVEERRRAYADQVFEEGDPNVPEQRKRYRESQERIRKAEQAIKDFDAQDAELRQRTKRYLARRTELLSLRGIRVVVSGLAWNEGYPLDGASALSRYFVDFPFVGYAGDATRAKMVSLRQHRGTLWVQAAGDTRGQTWTGLFRDEDGNGAMEFAPFSSALPKGRWTPELNFLAWQDLEGHSLPDLPSNVRLRVTLQWREPHDPALSRATDDPYRVPAAMFSLVIVKQRDPSGTRLASDDMEAVARTGAPVRLQLERATGTYEIATEIVAPAGGRFALRVEGQTPASLRPMGDFAGGTSALPLEIRPRIFLEVIDAESRAKGRVVFLDYAGSLDWPPPELAKDPKPGRSYGGVGMPADARSVLSVGAAAADGKPQFYSAVGAGPLRELLAKPDVLGFDALELGGVKAGGSWVAAAFNGGAAACLLGMDAPAQTPLLLKLLQLPPGAVLRIPAEWVK